MNHKGLRRFAFYKKHYFADVAVISSFARKFADPVPAICLKDVRLHKGMIITDHAWINPYSMDQDEPFPVNLAVGDTIGFNATVMNYEKGWFRDGRDYGLACIKSVEVISKGVEP